MKCLALLFAAGVMSQSASLNSSIPQPSALDTSSGLVSGLASASRSPTSSTAAPAPTQPAAAPPLGKAGGNIEVFNLILANAFVSAICVQGSDQPASGNLVASAMRARDQIAGILEASP
jgi:hypothetical protein